MAKTARNLAGGSGTVSATLDSNLLVFSTAQNFKPGAAVVLSDGQQFTIDQGSGTSWNAHQRAGAAASGLTFTMSDTSTSRARGSGPVIVRANHFEYESAVDDTGAADIGYRYFDTLAPDERALHPYTGDMYTGQSFYQSDEPGSFGVPPRFRYWEDYTTRTFVYGTYAGPANTYTVGWKEDEMPSNVGGKAVFRTGEVTSGAGGTVFIGCALTPIASTQFAPLKPFRLAKLPLFQAYWALKGGTTAARRLGFMNAFPAVFDGNFALNNAPTDGVYFEHTNTGMIKAIARKASVQTSLDTGVSVADGVLHHGQLVVLPGGQRVDVWVDGAYKGMLTTNLPLPTTDLGLMFNVGNPSGVNNVGMTVDYYYTEALRS
jgi:hypothetical protein